MCDAPSPHLVTDSSGDVANLHSTGLSDVDTSPAEVSDANIHPWAGEGRHIVWLYIK